ncbi:uncharacterized protein BDZ99DRAFT_475182 [Mytilinidion resinicola]|uniref:Uncharacterized protein n=1 Tax=Mytilinidion resinicola TaxID=574789 RepID=A0A6A6YUE5_9PEZI|nr:uncharacterized protein BDZ99DRAFT_475182 [Mytilinidion resinicola]KAF2811654.1 hypothetical protein BDZ99DRAFT_475182 [Mytilinidion resinicola]
MTISSTIHTVRNAFLIYIFTLPAIAFAYISLWEFFKIFYFLILSSTIIKIKFSIWTLICVFRLTLFLTASALDAKLTLACRLNPSTQPRPDFRLRAIKMERLRRTAVGQPWTYATVLGYWRMRIPAFLLVGIMALAMLLSVSSGMWFWAWVPLLSMLRFLISAVYMCYLRWIGCPALDKEYTRMLALRRSALDSVTIDWLDWLLNAVIGEDGPTQEQIMQLEDDWKELETRLVNSRVELEDLRHRLVESEEARSGTYEESDEMKQLAERVKVVDETLWLIEEEIRNHIE